MIKFVSLIVFLLGFTWTWCLFNSESKISVAVHAGLQSKLGTFIEETLKKAHPTLYAFDLESLSTKTLDENKVSAQFRFSYSEKSEDKEHSRQTVHGEAILNRNPSETTGDQKWVIQSVKTDQAQIEFLEGSVIGAGAGGTTEEKAAVAPTATEKTESTTTETHSNTAPTEEPKKTE